MPDGLVAWIDPSAGKAGVVKGGRSYVAALDALQGRARSVGARVHFEIVRDGGVERAAEVRLRAKKASGAGHGSSPVAGSGGRSQMYPVQVVGAWGRSVAAGALDEALTFYSPDAAVHLDGVTLRSHRHIRGYLETLPVLGTDHLPTVNGGEEWVVGRWESRNGEPGFESFCRVEHGLIVEQRFGDSAPPAPTPAAEAGRPVMFSTVTHGDVPVGALEYAIRRMQQVVGKVGSPILSARIKLAMASDPARARPAIAQASLSVNGRFIGARVAATDMSEAVDLLQRRLAVQLEHRAQHLEELHRRGPGRAAAGEWRHGDLAAPRAEYFDRPLEERRLVRHKPLFPSEQPIEEAAFDMDQLDHDFYLFRDIKSGQDSLLERLAPGRYRVQHLRGGPEPPGTVIGGFEMDDRPAPDLTVEQAVELLSGADLRFVFFADAGTRRGCLAYRRYDGHYGLITLV